MPREKLMSCGAATLDTTELLSVIIGSGVAGHSVAEVSAELLRKYGGSLIDIASSTASELSSRVAGLGIAKATLILAALELGYRRQRQEVMHMPLLTTSDVYRCFVGDVGGLSHEELWVAVLDDNRCVHYKECISSGGLNAVSYDVRTLLRTVVRHGGTRFAIAHNHPSGSTAPSTDDIKMTKHIVRAAQTLDIELHDHIIIGQGDNNYFSFAEAKLLNIANQD